MTYEPAEFAAAGRGLFFWLGWLVAFIGLGYAAALAHGRRRWPGRGR